MELNFFYLFSVIDKNVVVIEYLSDYSFILF